jgi:hypothetical protein
MQPPPPTAARPAMPNKSRSYNQKALAEIRNSLLPFANSETASSAASTISLLSSTSGFSSASSNNDYVAHLLSMGYHEVNMTAFMCLNISDNGFIVWGYVRGWKVHSEKAPVDIHKLALFVSQLISNPFF